MAVLLTAGSTVAFAAEQTAPVVGDVNGDGAVDVMDATEIQRWLAETRESIDTKAADVNRDGAVDVQDITLIQRYIAEFIPNFDAWAPKELTLDVSELTLRPRTALCISPPATRALRRWTKTVWCALSAQAPRQLPQPPTKALRHSAA